MRKIITLLFIVAICLTVSSCFVVNSDPAISISSIDLVSSDGLVDLYKITYSNNTTTTFRVTNGKDGAQGIQGIQGEKGGDGHTPVITIQDGYWHIDGVNSGVKAEGIKGETGNGISSIDLTSTDDLVDTYTITFTNGDTTTFTVTNGKDGPQGIQGIQGVQGEDGHTPVITIQNGYWYIDGVNTNVLAEGLKGDTGNGISNIRLASSEGLIDTYTITFTNGSTTTFTVTNGKDGEDGSQGIQGEKGEDGTSLLNGNGVPTNELGKIGDSYIDLDSWDFYVKSNDIWILVGNIKGDTYDENNVTEGLAFYPINETECAVGVGSAIYAKEIVIPATYKQYTVTTIAGNSHGFQYTSNLEKIILPNTIKTIETQAFLNSALKEIFIPINVTTIEQNAFHFCNNLDIYCEAEEEPVGFAYYWSDNPVFWGVSYESIVTLDGIRYKIVDDYAVLLRYPRNSQPFIPSVIEVEGKAYNVCKIGDSAFMNCQELTSIVLPDTIDSIGSKAFHRCSALKSVIVKGLLDNVSSKAFNSCFDLTIYFEMNVDSNGWEQEWNYNNRPVYWAGEWEYDEDGNPSTATSGLIYDLDESTNSYIVVGIEEGVEVENLLIPSKYDGKPVTGIGDYAFGNCYGLISIKIPDSVKSIGYGAFYECSSLLSVKIPDSVTSIGHDLFISCRNLSSVYISNSITKIPSNTFMNCINLSSVKIPNSVTSIGCAAFSGCKSLTSIDIPNSVIEIQDGAFSDCSNLMDITIPESVTRIGCRAFYRCDSLTSVVIPNSLTKIEEEVFLDCSSLSIFCEASSQPTGWDSDWNFNNLPVYWAEEWEYDDNGNPIPVTKGLIYELDESTNTYTVVGINWDEYIDENLEEVIIPSNYNGKQVTSIGNYAFAGYRITSVIIIEGVRSIGDNAFEDCYELKNVTLLEGVMSIGEYAFKCCYSLTSITLPKSVTSIGRCAFSGCYNLKSINLPEGVTSIDYEVFAGCERLKSIEIPSSVISIDEMAFVCCYSLTSIVIPESVVVMGLAVFADCNNLTIYCESKSKPSDWNSSWNCADRPVYWAGEWEYDDNGKPIALIYSGTIYEVSGIKYINFGSYPQTHVGDESLIAELNKLTVTNDRGYYEYNGKEYAKVTANPYHYGSYMDSGNTQYHMYSDGSKVQKNVIEWFVVEPIKWRIISENTDGSYQLYSENILDATVYYNDTYYRNLNGVDIAPNNYKCSNIRSWLNGYNGIEYKVSDYTNNGFLQRAFKDAEQNAIVLKEVDNSSSTTDSPSNQYACENTFDKIYLLSYQDLHNANYGFISDESRCANITDYAKAVGAYWSTLTEYGENGIYWLRSPDCDSSYYAYFVSYTGIDSNYVYYSYNYVYYSSDGVRVACTINLE